MPDLKFDGEVIPVAHLLPDDVLVFTLTEPYKMETLKLCVNALRESFPGPRRILVLPSNVRLGVERDSKPIPVGES